MQVDPIARFFELLSPFESVGLLTNQISFSWQRRRYLFQEVENLKRVFLAEHGLFAELQDQIPIDSHAGYKIFRDVEWVSLYGQEEQSLVPDVSKLQDLDIVIVDLQDVGSRYYTFLTTVWYTIQAALTLENPPVFCILDRPNPAGSMVEGSLLHGQFASFVGLPNVIHRHGLTACELLLLYRSRLQSETEKSKLRYVMIPFDDEVSIIDETGLFRKLNTETKQLPKLEPAWTIPPSPNMSSPITPLVYAGQCLLEGTNLSEGRGTTRPFEIFGAPYIDDECMVSLCDHKQIAQPDLILRPLRFVPMFHKFAHEVCNGWQMYVNGQCYHSLLASLDIVRLIKQKFNRFDWRRETYEYRDDLLAIEMLTGDPLLLSYLQGNIGRNDLIACLIESEAAWISEVNQYLLYRRTLVSAALILDRSQ
mgnify:CR=1 FL=1